MHAPPTSPNLSPVSQLRAGMIAIVLVIYGYIALPIGPKVTEDSLSSNLGRREVDTWMRVAEPLGFTRASFEQTVLAWSSWLVDTDRAIVAPFKPVLELTGTGQGWALFATPDIDPQVLTVEGERADGTVVRLFRRHDPDARFLASTFTFRRVRGIYDATREKPKRIHRRFAAWVAQQAFEADPSLVAVTVYNHETRTHLPGEAPSAETRKKHVIRTKRSP